VADFNPDYVTAVQDVLGSAPYFKLLGMELVDLKPGWSTLRLVVEERHLQPFGQAHGGVVCSILDASTFWAVFPELEPGLSMTTADLKVNYLAPVLVGQTLIATSETIRVGRTLGLAQGRLEDQASGRLLAFATSTLMVLPGPPPAELAALPPKFS
jgi:uncharacterized protein (TIGR00369 family)